MTDANTATSLKTDPVNGEAAAPAKTRKKKALSKAVAGKASKKFAEGDDVLLEVKHFHGLHATVVNSLGSDQYICRINEGQTGVLVQFSGDELVPATAAHLEQHNSTRLAWNYKD